LKLNLKALAVLLPLLLICSAVALRADAPAAIGTWDCVSETPDGDQVKWSLTIKDEGGTLTGVAGGDQGDMPVKDLKVEGDDVSFKVDVDANTYEVKFTVNGSGCEGKWSGAGASGTLKGTKRA
jgi:hypothetical protein